MNCMIRLAFSFAFLATIGLLMTLPGCSEGTPTVAKVSGKVTYDGAPVTSGSLTFAPTSGAAGRPATGIIQSDGSYTLTTYAEGDGAVIGRHKVIYSVGGGDSSEEEAAPAAGEHAEDGATPAVPFSGLVPKEAEAEVKAGTNEINIELVAGPGAGGSAEATASPRTAASKSE